MAAEMTELIAASGQRLKVEAPGEAHAQVTRLVRLRRHDLGAGASKGALMLAEAEVQNSLQSAADARTFLGALREAGGVGLVILGPVRLPQESLTVFRQLKLFLGAVPDLEDAAPEDLTEFQEELQESLDARAEQQRRQLRIVEQLLSAMNSQNPIAAAVATLARLCDGSALLYDSAGTVVESTGAAPLHLVHAELGVRDLSEGVFSVGRWSVIGRELTIRAHGYVLVLASRAPDLLIRDGRFILDSVTQLWGSFQALDSFAITQQVESSSQLLREIDMGVQPGKERQYWERMKEHGFSPFMPLRYLTATTTGYSLSHSQLSSITTFIAKAAMPALVSENIRSSEVEPGFRMLAEASKDLEDWLGELSGSLAIGVSQPYSQLSATPEEARSAQTAETVARRRLSSASAGASTVVFVDQLHPAEWLLARTRSTRDRAQLEKYVAPLRKHRELLQTLLVYFQQRLRIVQAARELGLHQNTLRYRLGKIEDMLHVRLNDPAVIANLYLALKDDVEEPQ